MATARPASRKQKQQTKTRRPPRAMLSLRKKVLFSAAICLSVLLALEFVLLLVGVVPLSRREDPSQGFSGLMSVFSREGDRFVTRPSLRKQPFNMQSFAAERPVGGKRVFCLGGSSAYGFPWNAEQSFSGVLEDVIAADESAPPCEVVNVAGVSYAMHRLNLLADELLDYDPDVFIIYSGHNEFVERDFYQALRERGAAEHRIYQFFGHSRIYSAMQHALLAENNETLTDLGRFDMVVQRDQHNVYSMADKQQVASEYRAELRRLVRRATDAGVKVLLVTVPCNMSAWAPQNSLIEFAAGGDPSQGQAVWSELFHGGKQKFASGDFDEAVDLLRRSLELAPHYAEAHYVLGQAYERLEAWHEARRCYQLACDADASPVRRLSAINEAVREVARQEDTLLVDADRDFQEQCEHGLVGFQLIEDYVHPTPEGHQRIAWLLWQAMKREGWLGQTGSPSRELFDHVIDARPAVSSEGNAEWLFNQAAILHSQGQVERAIDRLRAAVQLDPNYVTALGNLAFLLMRAGRAGEAADAIDRLLQVAPKDPDGHALRGELLAGQEKLAEAEAEYRTALAAAPTSVAHHNGLGSVLAMQGHYDDAVAVFERAIALDEQAADAHANLGRVHELQGKLDAAISAYQRAIQLDPTLVRAHYLLGTVYVRQERSEEAARHFEEALRLKPDDEQARRALDELRPAASQTLRKTNN